MDVAGFAVGEEGVNVGNFFGFPQSAKGQTAFRFGDHFFGDGAQWHRADTDQYKGWCWRKLWDTASLIAKPTPYWLANWAQRASKASTPWA
jgi:hypothetical protein